MASSSTPEVNYQKEVRFAVVMYGGVSLAIYINGVAQELLRLVRATAENGKGKALLTDEELSGSERVYRKLSYLLAQEPEDDLSEARTNGDHSGPIPTRFVVDTITGASAGGINGIFLAKALVRGQEIDRLQELWVREGAIEKLLNDRMSKDAPVGFDNPPPALLNAKRMYLELLKAFDEMDGVMGGAAKQKGDTIKASRPLVDELDLFVTTTDLHGAVLPMRLTDEVVFERRHKNVFRFVFPRDNESQPDIDFLPETNPFLAYAARCTSSFPFAFEPMMLTDIDPVLEGYGRYANDLEARSSSVRWSRFFRDYEKASGLKPVPPQKRAFADGGDLDNKPFGYAIDTLTRRHADYPVIRKLIYVEPSPEHPEDEPEKDQRPNFFENTIDALSTLPMYETIREDLQRVSLRNRLVVRINRVLENVDKDMAKAIQSDSNHGVQNVLTSIQDNHVELRDLTDDAWSNLYLDDMIKRKGRGYAAYHRLEIASVTDDLARIVTRGAGLNEDSDYLAVIRSLTRAWRGIRYSDYRDEPVTESGEPATKPPHPINQYLTSFNLAYPLRRISFIRNRIEFLHCLDQQKLKETYKWPDGFKINGQSVREFRQELRRIYRELKKPEKGLRKTERRLLSRPRPTDKLVDSRARRHQAINELSEMMIVKMDGVREDGAPDPSALLNYFLRGTKQTVCDSAEAESDRRANQFLLDHPDVLAKMSEIAEEIAGEVRMARKTAEDEARQVLGLNDPSQAAETVPAQVARECLQNYYKDYDDYDMIIFPVLYETEVGEPALVDVFRVSPEDAKALIDERSLKCRKLAGTALAHFGAFLEKRWRENDIMWGRLDGAERIIASLLPVDHPQKASLIGEAQAAIVYETIKNRGVEERQDLLCETLMRTGSGEPEPNLLVQVGTGQSGGFIDNLKNNAGADLRQKLDAKIDNPALRDHYLEIFAKNSKPEPTSTLETATRATTIVGKMFENLAGDYSTNGKKYAAWITRIGQVGWGLVELAAPKTIWNLLFQYWVKLLYLIELILIVAGTILMRPSIQQFGFLLSLIHI